MEAIITIVGFLGAGKTTLLKRLIHDAISTGWRPFVILNDYENAHLEAQQLTVGSQPDWIKAVSGSCICCSGIAQLRENVNRIPERANGITFIEANGTSDACALMGFLGVGLDKRFLPPVQISVVDVKHWQLRGEHNALEANQTQVSSLIVLSHTQAVTTDRRNTVVNELYTLNPSATILDVDELELSQLAGLSPSNNIALKLDHQKAHWSSCSIDLPDLPDAHCIEHINTALPNTILRVKGCAKITGEDQYTYFERTPAGELYTRPYNGVPVMGTKLLIVGPGSELELLTQAVATSLEAAEIRFSMSS